MRCLKRYIAREIYRLLTNPPAIIAPAELRAARQAGGHSLATATAALNTQPIRISEIERGTRPAPELTHRYRIWLGLEVA